MDICDKNIWTHLVQLKASLAHNNLSFLLLIALKRFPFVQKKLPCKWKGNLDTPKTSFIIFYF